MTKTMISNLLLRFDTLTKREKMIVTATTIVAIWACWDQFFLSPTQFKHQQLSKQLSQINQQLAAQKEALNTLQSGKIPDPNLENQNKVAALNHQLSSMQNQLASEGGKFITPRQMARALRDILKQNQQLNLLSLNTLPVTTLQRGENLFFPVYKHGIALTFSGHYLDTLAYLRAIESLRWQINWDSIDYQVKTYPMAETTIQAYTLSLEESWLGV